MSAATRFPSWIISSRRNPPSCWRDPRIGKIFDDEAVTAFVQQDPTTALTYSGLVVLDEFQRVPAVLSVVKRIVDRSSESGPFLLAGSVSARLLPPERRP